MNNIELSEKISAYLKGSKTKAKKLKELVAIHFNLLDVSENMYVEIKDGVINVMPYEYIDKQATVTASTEILDKLFSGALSMEDAVKNGYVKVEGDADKFKALCALIPNAKAEKPAAKKPAAKKAAKKPAAKKAAAPKKEAAKKPAAKKTAAKKTEEKAVEAAAPAAEAAPAKRKCGRPKKAETAAKTTEKAAAKKTTKKTAKKADETTGK